MSKAFGEENPTEGEDPVSWATWSDGAAGAVEVIGDADWGKMKLDFNPSGEEGRSAVYDLGSAASRKFTITENRYGTGTEDAQIQIRGDTVAFLQDDDLPFWTDYTVPLSRTWRYVQVRAMTITPRLGMWVWADNLKTKANCDAMIAFATGRMTDIYVFAIDDSIAHRTWLGTGIIGDTNATVIEGVTPWKYVYDQAHAAGIKVHAWMWMGTFAYIGGANGVDDDIPDNATYNDAGVWNFHDATARTQLVAEMEDFVDNNDVDGIHMNIESTTANITEADITDFLAELRTAIPGIEFSICTGASVGDDVALKFNPVDWFAAGSIDTLVLMGYYDCQELKSYYISTLGMDRSDTRIITGVGAEDSLVQSSDMQHKWSLFYDDNYTNYCVFCWGADLNDNADMRDVVDAFLAGTISVVQPDITKVSVTPSTSWTLTAGGDVQTTAYADVTDHTTSGPLKAHIEAAIGSLNPAVIYYRAGSAVTRILIGDREP